MIGEYALEPEVLSKPENIRYFLEQFGVHKGRLIADYPKRWSSVVYKMWAGSLKDVERRRFQVLLESISEKVLERASTTRSYNTSLDWLLNAESVQNAGKDPFASIVATENPRSHSAVLIADEITEQTPSWRVKRQVVVKRETSELAKVALPLILISKEILLIEPYFDPCDSKFQSSLRAMIERLGRRPTRPSRIELHCCVHDRSSVRFWEDCRTDLPSLIPSGLSLAVMRWKLKAGGERFHRRYVLTERGGIAFEGGLDRGKAGQTTDIYLLEADVRTRRWKEYQTDSTAFELDTDGPITITGTRKV